MLTFKREITVECDGWTVEVAGQRFHDCSLGALIQYVHYATDYLWVGRTYRVLKSSGQSIERTFNK